MMLFHEIYGCYFNTVAKILALAVKKELTDEAMKQVVYENAFSESFLTIIPALKNQDWQLVDGAFHTPLVHAPTMPLTALQKRWLKALCLDPRINLFRVNLNGLEDVPPLFRPEDFVVFDKYSDGDPYGEELYQKNFHTILDALHKKQSLRVEYRSGKGGCRRISCVPLKLEYSEKDDKFRLLASSHHDSETMNVSRIVSCELGEKHYVGKGTPGFRKKESLVFELTDKRNALERVMLHFAHFEKQVERVADRRYKVTVLYNRDDETELVIRVLSFGPLVKVTKPNRVVNLIIERLNMQKSCGLR